MQTTPQTIARQVAALFGVNATSARRAYADKLTREAMDPDPLRDTRITHQMQQAIDKHDAQARQNAIPDTKSDT